MRSEGVAVGSGVVGSCTLTLTPDIRLENDLRAMRLLHDKVIDTAIVRVQNVSAQRANSDPRDNSSI
jgi:hypothetical protein